MPEEAKEDEYSSNPSWVEIIKNLRQNEYVFLFLALGATALIWALGTSLENNGEPTLLSDGCKDIAKFWFSISIFDSAQKFFFRQDSEKDKEDLLNKATTRFERIMDVNKNIYDSGIKKIRDSYDIIDLKETILSLGEGDTLYCHDGSISDFSVLKEVIINQALAGVRFKFMALAPYCKNANRRAKEVKKEVDFYSASCQDFAQTINEIRDELARHDNSKNGVRHEQNIELRLYRSLMSIPFYLIEHNKVIVTAITGFYLTKASSVSMHIVWESHDTHKSRQGFSLHPEYRNNDRNTFIDELWEYWKYKWHEGSREYTDWQFLIGKWDYVSKDCHSNIIYQGNCEIKEESRSLRAEGVRLKTQYPGQVEVDTKIEWKTEVMHKYTIGDDKFLIMTHKCYPQSGDMAKRGVQAFISLNAGKARLQNETPGLSSTPQNEDTLEGEFFVTAPPNLPLFEVQSGRVTFTRALKSRESIERI